MAEVQTRLHESKHENRTELKSAHELSKIVVDLTTKSNSERKIVPNLAHGSFSSKQLMRVEHVSVAEKFLVSEGMRINEKKSEGRFALIAGWGRVLGKWGTKERGRVVRLPAKRERDDQLGFERKAVGACKCKCF